MLRQQHIKEGVIELAYTQKIHVEKDNNDINVYLMPYYMAENGVCREMIRLSQVDFEDLKINIDHEIKMIEREDENKTCPKSDYGCQRSY